MTGPTDRPDPAAGPRARMVVGVDGSDGARAALVRALATAARCDPAVVAVPGAVLVPVEIMVVHPGRTGQPAGAPPVLASAQG